MEITIAYLEPVTISPTVALQRAVNGFRRREGKMPTLVIAGEGIELPRRELQLLGLRELKTNGSCIRPGHVLVGIEKKESD